MTVEEARRLRIGDRVRENKHDGRIVAQGQDFVTILFDYGQRCYSTKVNDGNGRLWCFVDRKES